MVGNPWSIYEKKQVLKHAWFPIRDKWHVSSANLIFGIEDAYRFSKILIDAKAGVTFANTISNNNGVDAGHIKDDEMVIMKAINDRLLFNPIPDYDPYIRPEGAFLFGEIDDILLSTDDFINPTYNPFQINLYPNPVVDTLTITRTETGISNIIVVSVTGTKVLEKLWNDRSLTTQLDVSKLTSGFYFVKVSNNNISINNKIIISK
jgi:hypothetical protein